MELSTFLNTGLLNLDVLCFSEHWLTDEQIKTLNSEQCILADNFSNVKCNYGGTCTFVRENLNIRKVKYLKDLGS
jgi:hypothetical protein